jgi:hypothetical protein
MQAKTASTSATPETTPQTPLQAHPHHHTKSLFHHEPRQHQPRNVNLLHQAEYGASRESCSVSAHTYGAVWCRRGTELQARGPANASEETRCARNR